MRRCSEALAGFASDLFRPPYGHQNLGSHLDAWLQGYQVIAWDVLVGDWLDHDANSLAGEAISRIRHGSIVLLHDGLFDLLEPRFADRRESLQAVDLILEELGSRYRFVTVPELMSMGDPVQTDWLGKPDAAFLNQLERASGPPHRY